MALERFFAGLEIRASGRSLVGPAIRYGEVSPDHRERFEAGAFALDARTRWLDVGHDRSIVIAHTDGGGLELRDTPEALEVSATLPEIPAAMRALEDVKAGRLRGFSVEFDSLQERQEGAIRVVERAALAGIGLVRIPSYQGSTVEVRQGGSVTWIPTGTVVSCQCHTGECDDIEIEEIVQQEMRDLIAVAGDYKRGIASVKRGTMTLTKRPDGLQVELAPAALETPAGRELVAMSASVPIYARPIFDQALSEVVERDGVAYYKRMVMKAVLIGTTDNAMGWPEMVFPGTRSAIVRPAPEPEPARARRTRRWL